MSEQKEIIKQESQIVNSPAAMIKMAVEGNADLDKLEKLLEIQERWEANEARKAYHKAMAEFKANPPEILKDKNVSYRAGGGVTSYAHASLSNVTSQINEALSRHGLSASWQTAQNGAVSVICKITHVMGHSEQTTLSAQADGSGSKNQIQAIGSTITYLERYTLLALTGLATTDQDDDGVVSEVSLISESQVADLCALIEETKPDMTKFFAFMGVQSIEEIPVHEYERAVKVLEARRGK